MEAGKARPGFLWQAKQAKLLICDLVSFTTSNNGAMPGPDGRSFTASLSEMAKAMQFMHDTIRTHKITRQRALPRTRRKRARHCGARRPPVGVNGSSKNRDAALAVVNCNEFMVALALTPTIHRQPISSGIANFQNLLNVPRGGLAAASIVVTLLPVVMVLVFQRRINAGLTQGAVKE